MKHIGHNIGRFVIVAAALMLASCSEEDTRTDLQQHRVHLVLGQQNFSDVDDQQTRALPEGFVTYSDMYAAGLPAYAQIQGYLAKAGNETPAMGLFKYTDTGSDPIVRSWTTNVQVDGIGKYYLYGVMPKEDINSISITPYNNDYSKGAVLTLNGIDAITPNDLCVLVGVRGADDASKAITDDALAMNTRLGKFDIDVEAGKTETFAYLLADHIFCSLHFRMSVDAEYSKLRTIKVKKLELYPADGDNTVKTVDATITLVASNGNPLAAVNGGSIVVTTASTGTPDNPATLIDTTDEPLVLTTTPKPFRACFAPGSIHKFKLITHYDVYDRKGNLIRENQTAENMFTPTSAMTPGQEKTYNILVSPTYLYSLSGEDVVVPNFEIIE